MISSFARSLLMIVVIMHNKMHKDKDVNKMVDINMLGQLIRTSAPFPAAELSCIAISVSSSRPTLQTL